MRWIVRWSPCIAQFFVAGSASAVIVNTEPLFRKIHDEPWSVTAEANVNARSGNTRLVVLNGQAGGRYRTGRHEFLATAAIDRSIEKGETIGDSSFGHVRYRYAPVDRLSLEAFVQVGENRFQDIDIRNLLGAGPRCIAVRFDGFEWALGLAYMFEYEQLGGDADFPHGTERFTHRWSGTSSIRFDHAFLTIREVMFAQPAIVDFRNVRVLQQFDVDLHVTTHLSARWSLEQEYNAIAPRDVHPLDTALKAGLKLDW
jgi:hypothetical protein